MWVSLKQPFRIEYAIFLKILFLYDLVSSIKQEKMRHVLPRTAPPPLASHRWPHATPLLTCRRHQQLPHTFKCQIRDP